MISKTEVLNNNAVVTFSLSEKEMEIMKHLKEHGWMEFRRGEGSEIVDRLYDYGIVTSDDDAWHFTIIPTKVGKQIIKAMDV
ncbi:hypothetical protein X915_gp057 [Bacillus phage vB_BanS-Tsamsa]|uniref:Uncharacterized protein n=1 Tax=Bacillus phage vB_BanS-Tsamsa TaxID=1308863 RepID=U5J9Z3_9CAUD|nr:hypothetical protein X915_gp057 [Bacillus phage vB_BanS-Tsamsa]AGI11905.1 hypothetical protein [Bacillus phage vB_BanS-Tsamsa]